MSDPLLKEAQDAFALEDIYVREAHAHTDPEFDPSLKLENLSVQVRVHPSSEAQHMQMTKEDGAASHHLRYFVETGVRILKPGVQANSAEPKDVLAEMTAIFVVKYVITNGDIPPRSQLVEAFTDNVVHHMWPYWREFIQATTARLRLPLFMLPMRKVAKKQKN